MMTRKGLQETYFAGLMMNPLLSLFKPLTSVSHIPLIEIVLIGCFQPFNYVCSPYCPDWLDSILIFDN